MVAANGPSSTFTQDVAKYQAQNPGLSVSDIQTYNINRASYFSGTIAVCVIYGVFCLILLLITVFSPAGSQLITDTFKTFTVTFIIGMIIAVIMLTLAVVSYKPTKLSQNPYDPQMCPDYWKFQQTDPDNTTFKDASSQNQILMEYQCVNPNTTTAKNNMKSSDYKDTNGTQLYTGSSEDHPVDIQALYTYTDKNTKYKKTESTVDCTQVFPLLLNSVNTTNTDLNNIPNALACKYSEQCGVSWTNMCPAGPTTIA